ncbi:MAG: ABC transporter permease [Chloroflexota bacterium]|nr:MAG: ABC transporter permease [Chloroflexota bacterium]
MDIRAAQQITQRSLRTLQREGPFLVVFSLGLAILFWYLVVRFGYVSIYLLPPPGMVLARFLKAASDGTLLRNSLYTLSEVLAGLSIGVTAATSLGYLLAKSRSLERILSPYIVASQSVPVVAIAPLLVIWFGPGLFSKVLICALIVFFPVLINTVVGMRSVPADLRDLMRSLQATPWQTFRLLEVPASLPVFLGGLRIGATLSVIGAVVGEFVGADRGLGYMINQGKGIFDTSLVFVAVFTLILMAMLLYGAVSLLEARLLSWQRLPEKPVVSR